MHPWLQLPATIRGQIRLGFGTILLLGFVSTAIGYRSLEHLSDSSRAILQQSARVRELSLELQSNFLRARQAEENYLHHWKTMPNSTDEFVPANQAHLAAAYQNLADLQQIEQPNSELSQELELLESLFLNYEAALQATTTRIQAAADETPLYNGIQPLMKAIEQTVAGDENTQIQLTLWMIAANEQAYFNTQNQQYLTEVRANLDRLTYLLETTDLAFDQSSAQALTQDYLANLNAVLLLEQQVQVNTIVADSINQEIDAIIQTIGDTSRTRTEAARSELAQAANQSRAALLATALIALALTVWAILWLGQRLLVPITALHRAAEQIGRGDLNCSLHLPGNNEFAVVADTFNHMVTQLRQTLTTLEQRVLERTQALASTNHSLQERTQSLEQTLKQLHDSETNYRSLVDHLHAGVVVHDRQSAIVMCNPAACQLLETPAHDLLGLKSADFQGQLVDEFGIPLVLEEYPVNQVLAHQKPLYNCVVGLQSAPSADSTWVLINAFPTFNASGQLHQVVVTFADITDRKIAEEKLRYRALHDTLTGLPNRTLLVERLDHAIQRLKRQPDHLFAILFIDLNRFKVVNDSLGHQVGDQLLKQVAQLLVGHVRSLDTVARLGGDEFVILLEQIASPKEAIQVVERIQRDLKRPITVMGHTVFTAASIGIALSNLGYTSGQDILRDADNAMYRAKAQGQSGYAVFDPAMHQSAVKLLELETNLRQALVNQEFKLHYQPIISLPAQQLIGFEALVRWYPPNGPVILPNDFIPLAEETGLIIPLSEWVLHAACSQMQTWCTTLAAAKSLKMSVNITSRLFQDAQFFEKLDQTLMQTQLAAHNLKLEVTESVLLEDVEAVLSTLSKLQDRQIEISLDDFGTGYSSLSYLKRFPINTLKIDKSFVDSLEQASDTSLVAAIIQIANAFEMSVVAEGVETRSQQQWLTHLGCGAIQGYLIAPPLAAAEAEAFMKTARFLPDFVT
mgnify:FL=1